MSWAFLSECTVCRDMRCHKIVDLDTLSVIALRSHRDDNAVLILNLSYLTRCGGRGGVVTKWHQEEPHMLGPRYKIYNPKWSRKCVVLDYPSVIKPPTLTGWPGINRYTLSDYSTGLAVAFPYFFLIFFFTERERRWERIRCLFVYCIGYFHFVQTGDILPVNLLNLDLRTNRKWDGRPLGSVKTQGRMCRI